MLARRGRQFGKSLSFGRGISLTTQLKMQDGQPQKSSVSFNRSERCLGHDRQ